MLEKEIVRILEYMANIQPGTKEYQEASEQLRKLKELQLMEEAQSFGVANEKLLGVIGSIISIGFVLVFERNSVLTTKALAFIRRE